MQGIFYDDPEDRISFMWSVLNKIQKIILITPGSKFATKINCSLIHLNVFQNSPIWAV